MESATAHLALDLQAADLQRAYELTADAYLAAAARMLQISADPESDATAFLQASREADEIWTRLCELRKQLVLNRVAPPAAAEDRLQAVRLRNDEAVVQNGVLIASLG